MMEMNAGLAQQGIGMGAQSVTGGATWSSNDLIVSSQVERQCIDLGKELARLDDLASTIESRLGRVLSPDNSAKAEGVPEEMLVPLADDIRDHVKRANRIGDRLQNVITRLEI